MAGHSAAGSGGAEKSPGADEAGFQFQPAQVNGDPAAGSSHSRHAEMLVLSDHDQLDGTDQ